MVTTDVFAHTLTRPSDLRTLGRYRIERELGAGGMGVVYAAFDPGLERRVALKILGARGGDSSRLVREARAMARLNHPNIITVHEVGQVAGRDYVTMELVDGGTLAEWLDGKPRSQREIVAAYVAAGRGLVAAHAAGIVHRDFKPHNVLRDRGGRIVVTDFGLARSSTDVDPLVVTAPSDGHVALPGLTATGVVLGTPAYMAPEQWTGDQLGPATDQFAFCVALWEALVGERPFRGASADELRAAIVRGPVEPERVKLPRRIAPILARGLALDPDERWPSMDALLAALARSDRPRRWLAAGAAIAVVATCGVVLASRSAPGADTCAAPARDPARVWSGAPELSIGAVQWSTARVRACAAEPAVRARRLSCLDGVLARYAAVRDAIAHDASAITRDLATVTIAPSVCELAAPPRLTTTYSAASVAALAHALRGTVTGAATALPPDADACTRALVRGIDARVESPTGRALADEAATAAERCGDDRLLFDALVARAGYENNPFVADPRLPGTLERLHGLLERVGQPERAAEVAELDAMLAALHDDWDGALRHFDGAIADLGASPHARATVASREVDTAVFIGDDHRLRDIAARALPLVAAAGTDAERHEVARIVAGADWRLGDVVGAHRRLDDIAHASPPLRLGDRNLTGIVVDGRGDPVAGATVAYGPTILGDSYAVGLAYGYGLAVATTTTDAAGRYVIASGPDSSGVIIAQHGKLRSLPVELAVANRLVLAPTTTVRGHLDRAGRARDGVIIARLDDPGAPQRYVASAPVAADGSFELAGLMRGHWHIGALVDLPGFNGRVELVPIVIGAHPIDDLALTLAPGRDVTVVVRSTSESMLDGARVIAVRGRRAPRTMGELDTWFLPVGDTSGDTYARPVAGPPSPALAKLVRDGDVVATLTNLPAVEMTVCTVAFSGAAAFDRVMKHLSDLEVRCAPLAATATSLTIETPPMRRLD